MVNKVNFGFKKINSKDKENLVGQIFSSVAPKYDIMNDFMSLGIHRYWKKKMIDQLEPNKRLIDVASGTGDIAKRYYKKCENVDITLCDINQDMLDVGKNRLLDENIFKGLKFVCCNGEKLPFDDFSFDYYTIAFGIRNFTNVKNALKEAYRVLEPGGKFVCLEFAKVTNPNMAKIYDCYSMNIIPKLGKLIVNDSESYQYLVESIRTFLSQEEFIQVMKDVGFQLCKYENFNFGIAALYIGYKI
ncbi:MAG: bifunctional demethylmenaquinone methyltransferase/2-methoxy-6-polyprenyl-1,4-benzoquinol methylase UbiE [Pseudomonadota bacterium]